MVFFEIACSAIIALAIIVFVRIDKSIAIIYPSLAIAAWIGETTCIRLYQHYQYSASWHGFVDQVPILIPLIWPLVILSASQIQKALWPQTSLASLIVAAIVLVDASFIEVLAVKAGLWSWSERGYLEVPVFGILGWSFFAFWVHWLLYVGPPPLRRGLIFLAPFFTHLTIIALWWGLFRHGLRHDLGHGWVIICASILVLGSVSVMKAIKQNHRIPTILALPRIIATFPFIVFLYVFARSDIRYWLHALAVAIPYLLATFAPKRKLNLFPNQ